MELKIFHRTPTIKEYNELRRLVEWPTFEPELVKEGLANSFFAVVVLDENDLILGMGRIIGDKTANVYEW